MNKEENKYSVFELSVKDLLFQTFKQAKTKSSEDGAISAMSEARGYTGVLAKITNDRTLTSLYIDTGVITAHLKGSRNKIVKKLFKEELKKLEISGESADIIFSLIDSLENFDFIENDVVQDEKLLEKVKHTLAIVPSAERENLYFDLHRSIQTAFNRTVHEEMPKLMADFYDSILEALEKGFFGDMQGVLEAEKMKWHSLDTGFP